MLSAVKLRAIAGSLAAAAALTAALAACSTTTGGSGNTSGPPSIGGSSTHDFPGSTAPPSTPSSSTSSSTHATPSTTVHPAPATPIRTVHVQGGKTSYVVKIWAQVENPTCYDHAYGQPIITFLTEHPCSGMTRILATTTVGGRPVGFAETATSFTGTAANPYAYSSKFTQLEQANNTGSINDLLREGYRLPSGPSAIPAHEAFEVLGQDNGVTIWDAWYLDGSTPDNAKPLMTMAQDLFLQI